jgi:hypothetical protein
VPCGDSEMLADRIGAVVSDTALRRRLRHNARARYERGFTNERLPRTPAPFGSRVVQSSLLQGRSHEELGVCSEIYDRCLVVVAISDVPPVAVKTVDLDDISGFDRL